MRAKNTFINHSKVNYLDNYLLNDLSLLGNQSSTDQRFTYVNKIICSRITKPSMKTTKDLEKLRHFVAQATSANTKMVIEN